MYQMYFVRCVIPESVNFHEMKKKMNPLTQNKNIFLQNYHIIGPSSQANWN